MRSVDGMADAHYALLLSCTVAAPYGLMDGWIGLLLFPVFLCPCTLSFFSPDGGVEACGAVRLC